MESKMKPTITWLFVLTLSLITSSVLAQNRALSLDGDIGYMTIPSTPSLDISTELTIELWFTNDIPRDNIFLLMRNSGASDLYGLYLTDNSSKAVFYLNLKESGFKQIRRNGNFIESGWHHLAGTFDGQIMTLYIDGVKRASSPLNKNDEIVTKECPVEIGAFHTGFIDEVRLWTVARTQEEIQSTMNIALTGTEKSLAGYWNFDTGEAKDLSPNGNDAILHNNAQILEYQEADSWNTIPPTVIKTIPNSPENVPVDIKEIKFFFSKEMQEGWAIEYFDNLPLGNILWDDDMKALTLDIEQPLQPGTIYFVILNPIFTPKYIDLTREPNLFLDVDGNLLGEFFFTFTTEKRGEVDVVPPRITEIVFLKADEDGTLKEVLSDLSKEIPIDVTDIKIVFSEKMREKGNLSLKYSDNFPRRSVKWNKGGENSMTFTTIHLVEPLTPKSKYYIKLNVVDKKYVDLAGNFLTPKNITFVTVRGSRLVSPKGRIPTTWGTVRQKY